MRETLEMALNAAVDFLDGLDHNSVAPIADRATLLARFSPHLPECGSTPEQVVRELADGVKGGIRPGFWNP